MNTKTIVAGLGATAALAATGIHFTQGTMETEFLTSADYEFMRFISEHGRSFATKAEFQFRSKVFKETLAAYEEINSQNGTHRVAINFLADMTHEEKKKLLGYQHRDVQENVEILDTSNLAASVDWRTKGAVTPVKNQG